VYPGKGYIINEFTESGGLWGSYKGYYDPKHHTFTLYPTYNKFARGRGQLTKKKISAALIKIKAR
jgi:hypothetical protein